MSGFHNNALIGAGSSGYQIERSLRFNSPDSAYLNRTPASAGSLTTWTWSGWLKRAALTSGGNLTLFSAGNALQPYTLISFTSDQLQFDAINAGSVVVGRKFTTQVFRDSSAWYHLVLTWDTTNGTAADRMRMYVNGVRVTSFSLSSDPASNATTQANTTAVHYVGAYPGGGNYFNGYLTEINFIDGQALTPSSFGETNPVTGVWGPKRYAGTYGTNGFYLKFADNSNTTAATLGKDSSGNGNNWTPNNFSVTAGAGNDSMIDTPTPYADGGNGRGNYATWNPLDSTATLSNGNLTQTATAERSSRSTFQIPSSGLWYAEATATSTTNGSTISCGFGLAAASVSLTANSYNLASAWNLYSSNFAYINRNGTPSSSLGFTLTAGDVVQIAVDPANNRAWIGRNNTWYNSTTGTTGDPAGGANPTVSSLPAGLFVFANTFNQTWDVNFGQRAFAYTPPTGFLALNTQNLPEPSIKKPSSYFDTKLYTGNGGTQAISGLGFSPDLVWIKGRSVAYNHQLQDTVRGAGKELQSDLTGAETSYGLVSAFNSDGFTVFTNGTYLASNNNGTTYVAWCWDESATPGFDIVTYTGDGNTGRTVSHNLGVKPSMVMVKLRAGGTEGWPVWHKSLSSESYFLRLNETSSTYTTFTNRWTAFSSTTITLGNNSETNGNASTYVAYLWSEVAGFSKFGSYTGNGSADGPFVHCGFRPRWILFKNSNVSGQYWDIYDTTRDTYNAAGLRLFPNASDTESDARPEYDILSNGFKVRDSTTSANGSGNTIIFAAFAESPFKYSLAR